MSALRRLQSEFMERLQDDAPASGGLRFYRRSIEASRHGALSAAYPVVRRLVGDAFFREAAARFARQAPPRCGDLNAHGAGFAGFLDRYPHAQGVPCLGDVARLEWAVHESGFAADAPAFDFTSLARLDPEGYAALRLALHPSVRLLSSLHPVASIWEANQPGREGTPARVAGAEHVLVNRAPEGVRVSVLGEARFAFLAALAAGTPLGDAASPCEGDPEFAAWLFECCSGCVVAAFDATPP